MKNEIKSLLKILLIGILVFLGIDIYNQIIVTNDVAEEVQAFISNVTISNENANSSEIIKENIETAQIIEIDSTIKTNKEEENKYFYNQLDEHAKVIYKAIEANKKNMKTGNYEINLGNQFSRLLSEEGGEEKLTNSYRSAIECYLYDNPEVFYINFSKLYLNIETTTKGTLKTYRVFMKTGKNESYLAEGFENQEKIDRALGEVEKVKAYFIENKKADTYQNIKLVHDYLVESIEYEQTISAPNIYNLYGAVVNKSCVCEGYAKAFKYFMDVLDIPCVIVIGDATNSEGDTEGHAWNYVQLNEKWYAIDCTWDDPIIEGFGFVTNSQRYKYFLKGEREFNKSHTPNGQFSKDGEIYEYPNLSLYNY